MKQVLSKSGFENRRQVILVFAENCLEQLIEATPGKAIQSVMIEMVMASNPIRESITIEGFAPDGSQVGGRTLNLNRILNQGVRCEDGLVVDFSSLSGVVNVKVSTEFHQLSCTIFPISAVLEVVEN